MLLVLGRYANDDLYWVSADRSLLATRNGRLVRTTGLTANLKATRFIGADPAAATLHKLTGAAETLRLIDIDGVDAFDVPVRSTFETVGEEAIEILGLTFDTVMVRERNRAPVLDWQFDNLFWADRDNGFIWKSVQHVAPAMAPVEIEILKPAA